MKMGICYCQPDIMSQCVAEDFGDQYACDYFEGASSRNRCLFRNESMNNHCWNPEAQAFGREHGVVRVEDLEPEEEFNLTEDFIDEVPGPRRNCKNCMSYTSCTKLISLATAAAAHGGVTEQDLWNHGSACENFIGETKITISGGK